MKKHRPRRFPPAFSVENNVVVFTMNGKREFLGFDRMWRRDAKFVTPFATTADAEAAAERERQAH